MRILITGKHGQVGWELQETLASLGDVTACDHRELDLADLSLLRKRIIDSRPNLIVNAAAYTAVDRAESEPELAMQINGVAPGVMAEAAKETGAWLVHYSTDYVFDGMSSAPYKEDDPTNPLNVYGATKLAGENAIRSSGANHLILRTSWVYGARGKNFVLTILRLARERRELTIVNDQVGAPTWSRDIADATARIVKQIGAGKNFKDDAAQFSSTYNLTSAGKTSWFDFAEFLLAEKQILDSVSLKPTTTAQYKTPARRPLYSILDSSRLERTFGFTLPPWQESAAKVCSQISG